MCLEPGPDSVNPRGSPELSHGPRGAGETLGTWSVDQQHLWPKYLAVFTSHLDRAALSFSLLFFSCATVLVLKSGWSAETMIATAAVQIIIPSLLFDICSGWNEVAGQRGGHV